jgi:hypothetical protein
MDMERVLSELGKELFYPIFRIFLGNEKRMQA